MLFTNDRPNGAMQGLEWAVFVQLGVAWLGLAWLGLAWFGLAWLGLPWVAWLARA